MFKRYFVALVSVALILCPLASSVLGLHPEYSCMSQTSCGYGRDGEYGCTVTVDCWMFYVLDPWDYPTWNPTSCPYYQPGCPGYIYPNFYPYGNPPTGQTTLAVPPKRVCPPPMGWAYVQECKDQSCDRASCADCCDTLYPCRYNCDSAAVEAKLISYDEWAQHTACAVGLGYAGQPANGCAQMWGT